MNHQFTILPTQERLNYGTCVMANVFLLGRIALGLVWRTGEGWRTCLKWSLMNPSNSCCPIMSFPNDTSNANWIVNLCIVHSLSVHGQTRTISQVQARQQVFALGRGGKESQVGGGWQGGDAQLLWKLLTRWKCDGQCITVDTLCQNGRCKMQSLCNPNLFWKIKFEFKQVLFSTKFKLRFCPLSGCGGGGRCLEGQQCKPLGPSLEPFLFVGLGTSGIYLCSISSSSFSVFVNFRVSIKLKCENKIARQKMFLGLFSQKKFDASTLNWFL